MTDNPDGMKLTVRKSPFEDGRWDWCVEWFYMRWNDYSGHELLWGKSATEDQARLDALRAIRAEIARIRSILDAAEREFQEVTT